MVVIRFYPQPLTRVLCCRPGECWWTNQTSQVITADGLPTPYKEGFLFTLTFYCCSSTVVGRTGIAIPPTYVNCIYIFAF